MESFLGYARGKLWSEASMREKLYALSVAVRRGALDAMRDSERRYREQDAKRLYYLSMEFLMGRTLGNMLINLGIYDEARSVIAELGVDFDELQSLEPDAALGNGNAVASIRAVQHKISTEAISKILYPSDQVQSGRELRLTQEYFLVACAIADIVRSYRMTHDSFDNFSSKVAIQMNDTHPALAVAELMPVLIDNQHLPWEHA